ncbi:MULTISPECIES: hypothetical protein [unclassified Psychrobacter]|uniref:hypothetical protein n=1 Tax=unclassified Psychrobacter TaxID=196806 RepID=UPI0025B3A1C9|nr:MULTISPECIES: hypothetical protein [unclassified Psychrobacter]MDN3454659.1 hypothetical protein [Psychrobacter sp. APC 3350]MDN3503907.1 hypothetical protein [Psychrobacter sp. 5A.1]
MSKNGYLYYNSDKDVFDALHSRKFGSQVIKEQLKDRGIIVSSQDTKDTIIDYVSQLFLNYHDQVFIVETLNNSSSRKKYNKAVLSTNMSDVDIATVVDEVKVNNSQRLNENVEITRQKDGKAFTIVTTYTEADLSKSVMSQKLTKSSEVYIWEDESGKINIRGEQDRKSKEVIEMIQDKIKSEDESSESYVIELSTITDSIQRNKFFKILISSLDDLEVDDVKHVSFSIIGGPDIEDDGTLLPHVKDLVLRGNSVLESSSFNQIYQSGYYITKIEWSAIEKKLNGEKIDFSAEFSDTENCMDFNCAPLRFYKSKNDGTYQTASNKLPNIAISTLLEKIEKAAMCAHKTIIDQNTPT